MKVLLILVDGMRPDAIAELTEFKEFAAKGAVSLEGRTVMPSVTLPCHMSMFHSVDPLRHGVTTNVYTPPVRPIRGLFELLSGAGKRCAFFYNWEELRDIGRPGSLERSLYIRNDGSPSDDRLTDEAIRCIREDGADFIFLYLGATDELGHKYGWMSPEYLKTAANAWKDIARIRAELDEDWAVIFTADHGGHERHHGTDMPEDMTIPIGIIAPGYEPGSVLEAASIMDIAPTIAGLFGLAPDRDWEGKALK